MHFESSLLTTDALPGDSKDNVFLPWMVELLCPNTESTTINMMHSNIDSRPEFIIGCRNVQNVDFDSQLMMLILIL